MPKITLSINEEALPPGLSWRQKLDAAAKAGYDEIELSINDTSRLDMPYGLRTAMQGFIHDSGTRIGSLRLKFSAVDTIRSAVKFAEDMGIRIIILSDFDGEDLYKAVEYAASAGVIIGLEMGTAEKAMEYVTRINSPFLGVCPDIGILTQNVEEDLEKGRGHIFSAGVIFGAGRIDFKSACDKLFELGVRRFTVNQLYDEKRPECWEAEISSASTIIRGLRLGK